MRAWGMLLISASVGAMSPTMAYAQTTDEGAVTTTDEIVVTARRRAESLQDIPVAVTAVSGESLERQGVTQTRELFASTPGLYFSQSGQRQNDEQFYLTIRGVGSSPVVEPSVGLFVDGVYVPSLGWTADFLDLERVEILRGPQGALFGRNTEGGAVSVITRKPSDELRGRFSAEAAEFGSFRGSAAVSGPLSDRLFVGIAGFASTTNGYIQNVTRNEDQDNRDRFGGRLTLRALVGEKIEIIASADYLKSDGRFDAYGDAVANQAVTVVDPQAALAQRGTFLRSHALAGQRYTTYGNAENSIHSKNFGAGLTVNADVGGAKLTSISGFRRVTSEDTYDNDGVATANSTNAAQATQRILSEELRLSSDSNGPLEWLVGGYGFTERLTQGRLSSFYSGTSAGPIAGSGDPFGFVSDNVRIRRDGFALFAQGSYKITPELEVTVGGRYSQEKVKQTPDLRVRVQITPPGVVVNVANATPRQKTFDGFSPSGSISYKFAPNLLVYGSIATGFKGGGFTKELTNSPDQNLPLGNETSINYELGFKGDLFDRALTFNAALFYTKLSDQQLSTRIELAPGSNVFVPSTLNIGKGHTQGVEIEGVLRPTRSLRLTGNLSYTDAKFDDYIASPATPTAPAYDRAGQEFPEVPKWLASASIEYAFELGLDTLLTPMVSWRHVGNKYVGQGNAAIPFITIDSYDVFDAQLSLKMGNWSVAGFVKNLADKYYFVNRFQLQPATSATGNQAYAKPGAPRQFGVRVAYQF